MFEIYKSFKTFLLECRKRKRLVILETNRFEFIYINFRKMLKSPKIMFFPEHLTIEDCGRLILMMCDRDAMVHPEKRQRQFEIRDERTSKHFKNDCKSTWDETSVNFQVARPSVESAVSAISCFVSFYGPAESAIAHLTCCRSF